MIGEIADKLVAFCKKRRMQMPRTLPFDAAVGSLRRLVEEMVPGEELVLTVQGEPKAIVTKPNRTSWPCQPGTAKDTKHWMARDFDAPLDDFAESWNDQAQRPV